MPSSDTAPFLSAHTDRDHDLCAVGTALIDYLSHASLDVVAILGVEPGAMTLIDGSTAAQIRAAVGEGEKIVSGGTVANTAAGVASLGGSPVYVGAVASDDLGRRYAADLVSAGVSPVLEVLPIADDGVTGTGTCYVMVTPDGQRTMATTLGVSGLLGHETISESVIADSSLVYFDGYMLDFPDSEAIVNRIIDLAKASSTNVAIGLADPFVVDRHGDRLRNLIERVDLVFSNQDEALALTGADSVDAAMEQLRRPGRAIVITCGADGALLGNADGVVRVAADLVPEVADTTGAGDLFAAGVCFGATHGFDAEGCGRLGVLCAAEAISHLGARPATPLRALAEGAGLLA
jgi:sugar/nucleoside kinase (ribokinase family)